MNYYISDLHLFQEKHLVRNSRPFHDTEEMWYAIKKNWEEKVTRHDTVYIVGDVCGIISGGIGAVLAISLATNTGLNNVLVSVCLYFSRLPA